MRTQLRTSRLRTIVAGATAVAAAATVVAVSAAVPEFAAGTTTQISAATHAAGFRNKAVYTFPGTKLGPQWGVYNSATGGGGNGNDSRDPSYVTVSGGYLHLKASGNVGSGVCLCAAGGEPSTPYGRWDIYANLPVDPHHNFGILLWPNNQKPKPYQELDIAEFPGPAKTVLQNTVHLGPGTNKHSHFTNGKYAGWHKYSVVWSAKTLSFWVDDNLVWQADPSYSPVDPMHLVLQGGIYSTSTPTSGASQMLVKAIRYYR